MNWFVYSKTSSYLYHFHYLQHLLRVNADEFLQAIGHIAKARGMSQIAKDTGLGRESLYKSFRDGASPKFETVMKVMHSLGVQLRTTA